MSVIEEIKSESKDININFKNNILTIEFLNNNKNSIINVYDFKGYSIKNIDISSNYVGQYEIDLSNYPINIYFCSINYNNKINIYKIIK